MTAHNEMDLLRTRREAIRLGATGLLTLVGLGKTIEGIVYAQSSSVISTPALIEGPYWIDETAATFFRSDIRANLDGSSVQSGLPLHLGLTVAQISNGVVTPLPNAFVYIWHASAEGLYSGEAAINTAGTTYLRGYQVSNAHGSVQFYSIYPGWYAGRTVHIHLRVRLYPNNDPTQTPTYDYETQLFFDDAITSAIFAEAIPYNERGARDTVNSTDSIYLGGSTDADGVASNAGALTTLKLSDDTSYVIGTFKLVLNLSLAETTGQSGGGNTGGTGGAPPGGGTGGPPPGGGTGGPPPGGGTGGPGGGP
jgi:protocatechuate 3,4-dioxygenase beta subunit